MGVLILNAKDQLKLEVISKLDSKRMSVKDVSLVLSLSERSVFRLLKNYREYGAIFLKHRNSFKTPWNKTDPKLKKQVQQLIKEKYFDFNVLHLQEKLVEEDIHVKRETLRKWAHEISMVKRAHKRKKRPRKYRQRLPQAGMLVQMDGSHHKWFGGRETCLVAMIDDANNFVHAEFFEGETTLACMKVLRDFIDKHGVFKILYTDKAGVFGGIKRNHFSQVERALSEVGSQVVYAHSPEAKGRVERLFNTLQDRLVPEMRISKVRTIEQANEFLKTYLSQVHNPKYTVLPVNPQSVYAGVPKNMDLKEVFCVKEFRKIAKDHTISFNGEKWSIANEFKFSIAGNRIEIRYNQDRSWQAWFGTRKIKLIKIQKLKKVAGIPIG